MGFMDTLQKESSYSVASGNSYQYVVLQVTLKEKLLGTGSGNLTELEQAINHQAQKGYRLRYSKRLFNKVKTALSSGFLLFIGKSEPEKKSFYLSICCKLSTEFV